MRGSTVTQPLGDERPIINGHKVTCLVLHQLQSMLECETQVDTVLRLDRLLKIEAGSATIPTVDTQVSSECVCWFYCHLVFLPWTKQCESCIALDLWCSVDGLDYRCCSMDCQYLRCFSVDYLDFGCCVDCLDFRCCGMD